MTFKTTLLAGTILGVAALASGQALAQNAPAPAGSSADVAAMSRQIQALQGQLKSLEEKLNKEIKAVDSKVSKMPTVTAANGRPRIVTADKNFDFAIRSRFHLDYGTWFPENTVGLDRNGDLSDGFNVRRARLGIAGKVFGDWGFEMTADFAGTRGSSVILQAANLTYNGVKDWSFIVGLFQPKFTFDDSTSSNDIPFMERSSLSNIMVAIGGADTRSGIGATYATGPVFAAAYVTGDRTGAGQGDDQVNVLGRLAYAAVDTAETTVSVGLSGVYQVEPAQPAAGTARSHRFDDRPNIRIGTDTSRFTRSETISGVENLYGFGGDVALMYRSFWAAGEYAVFGAETLSNAAYNDPEFNAYYVSAGYILTGERRKINRGSWTGVTPAWPLGANGTGAWEVAVRYDAADLSDESSRRSGTLGATSLSGEQTVWTFGVNWYPNSAIRFMVNYLIIENDRPGTRTTLEADALAARVQFQF